MPGPKITIMADILEEHFEELAFLFSQRSIALDSPAYTMRELKMLDERIEAHTQGLLVAGERLPSVAGPALGGDDPWAACAAAYALLRSGQQDASRQVAEALGRADEKQLPGLGHALRHGPVHLIKEELRQAAAAGPVPVAAVAAEALAVHGLLERQERRLAEFFASENAQVRQAAWRIVAVLDVDGKP